MATNAKYNMSCLLATLRYYLNMFNSSISKTEEFLQTFRDTSELAGHPVIVKAETASTNSDAMELGRNGVATGTVILAASQSGGRGRLGKKWASPPGSGLYFSLLLRPNLDPADLPKITLSAGVALGRAVSHFSHFSPMIKWPNDLLIDGKKCGGILTESEFSPAGQPLVALGIGINVFTPEEAFPAELRDKATSLSRYTQRKILLPDLLQEILVEVHSIVNRLEKGDFAKILEEWRIFDATLGKSLSWVTTNHQIISGISLGPDNEGRLHIRDNQGSIYEVLSGDIRLQSP